MNRDQDRQRAFTRRALMLGAGKAALVAALGGRLYYLQVVEADRYRMLADENRISLRLIPPRRGLIVDRFGQPLAANRLNYRIVLVAEQARDVEGILDRLSRLVALSAFEREKALRDVQQRRRFVPVIVRENLSWEEVARIEVNAPDLPGVSIDVGQSRHYPYGPAAAHILGYVGPVAENELTGDPLLELPEFRIGKNGVERHYDLALRGSAGTSEVEVNAIGRVIRELSRREGRPGSETRLTIDIGLQEYAAIRIAEDTAAAVVMDVQTGEVVVLASSPAFDPNVFNGGLTNRMWRDLVDNPRSPLSNKAIAGQYAPGSTFKMVVTLAALEAEVITLSHTVFCSGVATLGDSRFHCWRRNGHGRMGVRSSLKESCDVFFYDIARRVGIDRIADMARRLGLGATLGVDLPGERPGLLPTRDWKLANIGESWQVGETLVAGIGQGYILTTPLQLATMTARLVNGGRAVSPRLTPLPADAPPPASLGLPQAALDAVLEAMVGVTNERQGTAYAARIHEEGMRMGGKTGTSQVRRITMAERQRGVRSNEEVPWHLRDHALFVGFAPIERPRYAVAVVVEHGGGGSAVAAPIARDILLEAQRRDPIGRGVAPGPVAALDLED